MSRKNRTYIIITGIVAITLIWLSQSNKNEKPKLESPLDEEISTNDTADNTVNTLDGALWASDDKTKGNLMLITKDTTVYINTSRDYSDLVGKSVVVSINGTSDNFTLLNIEENRTKDGFIQTN